LKGRGVYQLEARRNDCREGVRRKLLSIVLQRMSILTFGLPSSKFHGLIVRFTEALSHAREEFEGVDGVFKIMARIGRLKVQCARPYHLVKIESMRIGWSFLYG